MTKRKPAAKKPVKKDAEKTAIEMAEAEESEAGVFILWNPESSRPPKVVMHTFTQACRAAEDMTRKHGGTFYVMKAVTMATLRPAPVDLIRPVLPGQVERSQPCPSYLDIIGAMR